MNRYLYVLTLIVISFFVQGQNIEEKIIGIWNFKTYNQDSNISYYLPVRKLKKKIRGFQFKEDGKVTVRINGAGCAIIDEKGNSYVSLSNTEGNWKLIDDNFVQVKFETFMGVHTYKVTISDGKLKVIEKEIN